MDPVRRVKKSKNKPTEVNVESNLLTSRTISEFHSIDLEGLNVPSSAPVFDENEAVDDPNDNSLEFNDPFHIGNNQGLEGKNNDIKKSHTFRRRLRIPALFECLLSMVHEWVKENEDKLFANRNDVIELKDKDAGYEWKKMNDKPCKI